MARRRLIALLTDAARPAELDTALAAIVASQLYHLKDMRGEIAAEVVGVIFTPELPRKDASQ